MADEDGDEDGDRDVIRRPLKKHLKFRLPRTDDRMIINLSSEAILPQKGVFNLAKLDIKTISYKLKYLFYSQFIFLIY